MKKSSINWNVKQFMKMIDKGSISFDYPIQREGCQWDDIQKALWIHSLAIDFPVPALYSIVEPQETTGEEKKPSNVYFIIDGKQRLTNTFDFVKGLYFLHEDTPNAIIDGQEYILAEKTFDQLDEEVQDAILSFSLQIYRLDEITDEEIEDLFYRLNNGTPLSKQQKAKAKMGTEWAKKIKGIVDHKVVKEISAFTPLQIRKADHETAILQTMMLIDNQYAWKSIASNEVFSYSQTFKNDNAKDKIVEKIIETMDYLSESFNSKESVLLKKVNFPMTLLTAMEAKNKEISPEEFSEWRKEFKDSLKNREGSIYTDYKEFGGAGSVKKDKTLGRVEAMKKHLEEYHEKKLNQQQDVPIV